MAALQNIGAGHSNDAFYRYKMPKMITKIEGQGNGIKTNVVNMVDIAKALVTNIEDKGNDNIKTKVKEMVVYITKYFGYELGVQSKFDEKTRVSVVNGAHDNAKLVRHLEDFIEKYVQCYRCRKPETAILVTKTMRIQLECAACGFISDVDMRDADKLTKFILKNPPHLEHQKSFVSVVEDQHSLSNGSLSQADDDDIQWYTDTSLEAARQHKQLSVVKAKMAGEPTKEKTKLTKKVVGSPPAPCNAGTTEPKEKSEGPKAMENGKTIAPSNEKLAEKVKMNLKGSSTVSQVQLFLGSLDGSPQEVMTALLDALFGGNAKRFSEEVTKKKNYLAIATQEEGSQILLLRAIESLCRKSSPKVMKEVALVLKTLYDADVLEEEYMVQWYQEGLAGAEKNCRIWKNVKPFIEWLQNAESESESE